jgi:hypothetical protein
MSHNQILLASQKEILAFTGDLCYCFRHGKYKRYSHKPNIMLSVYERCEQATGVSARVVGERSTQTDNSKSEPKTGSLFFVTWKDFTTKAQRTQRKDVGARCIAPKITKKLKINGNQVERGTPTAYL